ncbi:MAG: cell division protein SepF [Acidothermus sp.]|nr:cell division protein SepF [Acidothermus sp.]MCL6537784.1 cell division protein SepF [Acidothermus sp.]
MAFMRKAAVYLGLVEDDEERYDDYDDYQEPEPEPRRVSHASDAAATRRPAPLRRAELRDDADREVTPRALEERPAAAPLRVTTLHPRTYNEARAIGEHFREGIPVIMNLTEMDDADAKRLVDFAAGLIFGLRGSIERITNKVFLLSPQNVEVTAEDKRRMAEGGFFNQS